MCQRATKNDIIKTCAHTFGNFFGKYMLYKRNFARLCVFGLNFEICAKYTELNGIMRSIYFSGPRSNPARDDELRYFLC